MARARSTLGKLQRDQAKRAKAQAKQEDRVARREAGPEDKAESEAAPEDQAQVLEEFAQLHEDLADGRISIEDFEIRQEQLRARMIVE
jgi:hypothetical protein